MEDDKHLDEDFRKCVSDMKPHTKSLPYKSGALDSKQCPPQCFTLATTHTSPYLRYVLLQKRDVE